MPRISRAVAVNYPHHIIQRGNNRQGVFLCDQDHRQYLHLLKKYAEKHHCWIWAYCLMNNHVHLLLVPQEESSLGKTLQGIALCYTQHFNRLYNRTGRLWESRYYSCIVDRENYLWAVSRYIEQNPVRAGLAGKAEVYEWSSGRNHILNIPDPVLTGDNWLLAEQRVDYVNFLEQRNMPEEEFIRRSTCAGRPLGQNEFLDRMEHFLGRHLRPGERGRPWKLKK